MQKVEFFSNLISGEGGLVGDWVGGRGGGGNLQTAGSWGKEGGERQCDTDTASR